MGRPKRQLVIKCQTCKREISVRISAFERGRKYCSLQCRNYSSEWKKANSLGHLGKKASKETKLKMSISGKKVWSSGDRKLVNFKSSLNPAWKGDSAGYGALHEWIRNRVDAVKCQSCGIANKVNSYGRSYLQMANISGKYFREESDWIVLCPKCHSRFDKGWLKIKRDDKGRFKSN